MADYSKPSTTENMMENLYCSTIIICYYFVVPVVANIIIININIIIIMFHRKEIRKLKNNDN